MTSMPGHARRWLRVVVVTGILTSLPGAPAAWSGRQNQNPDTALLAAFHKRVKDYVDLRERLKETLPKLTDQSPPEDVEQHQRALERLIARARAGA